MKRLPVVPVCVLLLGVGALIPVLADSPEALLSVTTAEMAAEANAQIEDIKMWTASAETFKEKQDDIRRTAGVLAVLGHALAEHPEGELQKVAGPDLRDAALELAASKDQQAAIKALQHIQAAQEGTHQRKAKTAEWKDLISMDDLMHVVNAENAQVRRAARRSRDPEGDSRKALTIALLTIPMAGQGEDYLAEEDEIKLWKKYAGDFGKGMTDLAGAFKAKDKAAIQKHLAFAQKACDDCHAKFRPTE